MIIALVPPTTAHNALFCSEWQRRFAWQGLVRFASAISRFTRNSQDWKQQLIEACRVVNAAPAYPGDHQCVKARSARNSITSRYGPISMN